MAKATIAELEAAIAELESVNATLQAQLSQPQPTPRGKAYLEGPCKFFKQARNQSTGEMMNFYEFVLAEEQEETRDDGSKYRIELPYDQCRITGNRPELVQEMQQLFAANRFVVLRLHGAWRADGIPTLNPKGYARAPRKCFWVTRVEVLTALPKDQPTYQAAEPVTVLQPQVLIPEPPETDDEALLEEIPF